MDNKVSKVQIATIVISVLTLIINLVLLMKIIIL